MKIGFVKFLMIVALGATVSIVGGSSLASAGAHEGAPVRLEVRILETAVLCDAAAAPTTL